MPFTPVQALQLYHGVESPANFKSPDYRSEVPCADWDLISKFTRKAITETKEGQRETALILENRVIGSNKLSPVKSEDGVTLILIEGFDPAISRGYADTDPYWPYKDEEDRSRYVPHLRMTRTDRKGVVLHRHLRWMASPGEVENSNPNNVPGEIGMWRPPTNHSLYQGDAIFLMEASISLEVVGAYAATLRIARLADVPEESEWTKDRWWVSNKDPDQSDRFQLLLGDLLECVGTDNPPVLYLGRRPVVSRPHHPDEQMSESHDAGGHVRKPHFAVDKVWPGIMLGVIEDFVVAPGDEAGGDPSLTIAGSTAEPGRVLKSGQQKPDGAKPDWQKITKSVDLEKDDAFYVLDSKITMTVNNASVAYIRIVGVDPKRRKDCNGRAC